MPARAPMTDHEEIRQLALRYAIAIDRRDLDLLVSLYVEDVWVGKAGTGRGVLRKDFGDGLKKIGVSMLFVGNHLIELDADNPDKATGTVYCRARIEATPDSHRMVEHAIQYSDWYERRDGRWYFARRKHELFWGVELTERPLDQPDANWPAKQVGTGTVPYRYESWTDFWAE